MINLDYDYMRVLILEKTLDKINNVPVLAKLNFCFGAGDVLVSQLCRGICFHSLNIDEFEFLSEEYVDYQIDLFVDSLLIETQQRAFLQNKLKTFAKQNAAYSWAKK